MIVPSPPRAARPSGGMSGAAHDSILSRNAGASWAGLPPWPRHTPYFAAPMSFAPSAVTAAAGALTAGSFLQPTAAVATTAAASSTNTGRIASDRVGVSVELRTSETCDRIPHDE